MRRGGSFAAVTALVLTGFLAMGTVAHAEAAGSAICPQSETALALAITGTGSGETVTLSCPTSTVISFSPNASGSTGMSGTGTLSISQSVTLDAAQSPGEIVFTGNKDTELMSIAQGVSVTLNGLNLQSGYASNGGAIDNKGTLTVENSSLSGNSTKYGLGGGIDNESTVTVENSTFSDNSSEYGPGGAIGSTGTSTVTNSTFSGNTSGDAGGAVYSYQAGISVTATTFWDNSAMDQGGAIDVDSGSLTAAASTFSSNSAEYGGAVQGYSSPMSVTDSTVSGNSSSGNGGAIINFSGTALVANTTISGNSDPQLGGAVAATNGGQTTLAADIIAGSGPGINCNGGIADAGHNLVDDSSCGFTNGSNGDIVTGSGGVVLSPVANNGGPTETVSLPAGSPAIDAIAPNATFANPITSASQKACPAADQRGLPRPGDTGSNNPQGNCDIGSYEYTSTIDLSSATLGHCPTYADFANGIDEAAAGGTVTIECATTDVISFPGAGTIAPIKSFTLNASNSAGTIALDGGYNGNQQHPSGVQLFTVPSGVSVTLDGLTLQHAFISGNGAAINNDGTLTLTNSTISDSYAAVNQSGLEGYGVVANEGTLTVTGTTFSGNSGNNGGALYSDGTATITNSTFSGNSSGAGSAIYEDSPSGRLTLTNSTVSGNFAFYGAVIRNLGPLTIGGDIIAGNTEDSGNECAESDPEDFVDMGYNLNDDGSCLGGGSGDSSASADLGSLASNGGPTQTMALEPGGPELNAIPTSSELCPATDQRGYLRPGTSKTACDIGSFELQPQKQSITFTGPNQSTFTYGASPFTVSATGGGSGNPVTFSVAAASASVCSAGASSGNDATITIRGAGACMIDADQAGNTYYAAAPQHPDTFTINRAPLTVMATSATAVYGSAFPTLSYSANFVNSDTASAFTTAPVCTTTALKWKNGTVASAVGSYPITCSGASAKNYSPISYVAGTLKINPKPLAVTAKSMAAVYGSAFPTLGYSANFVNGDTASSFTAEPVCKTTAVKSKIGTVASAAGTYPITCSGASAKNYSPISYVAGNFTVTPAPVTIAYQGPKAIKHGSNAALTGKLTSGKTILSGRNILISIGSGSSLQKCITGKTNSEGIASCVIKKVKVVKTTKKGSPITLHYAGDPAGRGDFYGAGTRTVLVKIT